MGLNIQSISNVQELEGGFVGYVIPVVYAKLISRKEQSITQLNISNNCYVLD